MGRPAGRPAAPRTLFHIAVREFWAKHWAQSLVAPKKPENADLSVFIGGIFEEEEGSAWYPNPAVPSPKTLQDWLGGIRPVNINRWGDKKLHDENCKNKKERLLAYGKDLFLLIPPDSAVGKTASEQEPNFLVVKNLFKAIGEWDPNFSFDLEPSEDEYGKFETLAFEEARPEYGLSYVWSEIASRRFLKTKHLDESGGEKAWLGAWPHPKLLENTTEIALAMRWLLAHGHGPERLPNTLISCLSTSLKGTESSSPFRTYTELLGASLLFDLWNMLPEEIKSQQSGHVLEPFRRDMMLRWLVRLFPEAAGKKTGETVYASEHQTRPERQNENLPAISQFVVVPNLKSEEVWGKDNGKRAEVLVSLIWGKKGNDESQSDDPLEYFQPAPPKKAPKKAPKKRRD